MAPTTIPEPPAQLRVRQLSVAEALRLARTGNQQERVALERVHGRMVWDALLANPSITVREVARIAGMGLLPMPLLDVIAGNAGWLGNEAVRRALLTHPRLRGKTLERVLRSVPKSELVQAAQGRRHPQAVRDVAQRLLRGGG